MTTLNPHPPHILHSSTRISHSDAHAMLSAFLERANNEAAYRPDSTLTERGPVSSSIDASSDLTLRHLHRVKLGLEGHWLGPEELQTDSELSGKKRKRGDADTGAGLEEDSAEVLVPSSPPLLKPSSTVSRSKLNKKEQQSDNVINTPASTEWQDKDSYELAQAESENDVYEDEDEVGGGLEQPADRVEAEEIMAVEVEGTGKKAATRREEVSPVKTPKRKKGAESQTTPIQEHRNDVDHSTPGTIHKEERKRLKKEKRRLEKKEREAGKRKNL